MRYTQYTVYTDIERLDELTERLTALGITGLIINDPRDLELFEGEPHGFTWDYVDESVIRKLEERPSVSFYLEEGASLPPEAGELIRGFDTKKSIADDQDWLHKWEEYYVPLRLSERIVAKPVWRDYAPNDGDIVVEIDPGLAFGTGSSPTSYLTVRLMDRWFVPCERVFDVGCGTGILSIIAAMLGAGHIEAVDVDPEAVASTAANAELNTCSGQISVRRGDLLSGFEGKADSILANLTAELVMRLAPDAAAHLKNGGLLFASGIIDDKEKACCDVIEAAGFEIIDIERDDCWSAVCARRL